MENYIIIGVIAVVMCAAIFFCVKHFKGEGGCCGGGSYKPKKKKLSGVKYQKTFHIGGMHCAHCKHRVEEIVNDMKGVSGKVDLGKGMLTVSYAEDVADERIQERIERAGYTFEQV